MTNYVRVKKAPLELAKKEYVIEAPNFLDGIKACEKRKPKSNVVGNHYLRDIVTFLGQKYVGQDFDAFRQVNISKHIGVGYTTDEALNKHLVDLFTKEFPDMITKFVEQKIKERPNGTELIYFLGTPEQADSFHNAGIHEILERDLEKVKKKSAKTSAQEIAQLLGD